MSEKTGKVNQNRRKQKKVVSKIDPYTRFEFETMFFF